MHEERIRITVLQGNGEYVAQEYERMVYPGGEVNVRIQQPQSLQATATLAPQRINIDADLQSSDDVMALLMLTDAVRRMHQGPVPVSLTMGYVPYGRQDRVNNPGEALALHVFADLINAQKYHTVTIVDPHSDVTPALIERVVVVSPLVDLDYIVRKHPGKRLTLVAPDAGALKKVAGYAKQLGLPWVRADKSRDPLTGKITGTVVYGPRVGDETFLIVDDICDGGRTFIDLAKALREFPPFTGKVLLYVSHGIFSKGPHVFDGLIDEVYVAHSFLPAEQLPSNFHIL